ncbi:bacteriocin immunity protein [Pseudomonas chlororaphis]|uniref:bacteriocin immunity protein n=1 Tax=Pseudomonas chlororaphis TaxID=587753 RepID=UPI002366B5AF|nr:bacteriocin immunity protein [Pseudomonas chlororaphis]WDG52357.1 bacteriocin immunity protein [Pseudomonas chlororaphis]WDH86626.1 bacteriocin immunity protein [Pseudomonas chlororaphis]
MSRIEDYTENEFLQLINEFFSETNNLEGAKLEKYLSRLAAHFEAITRHPAGYGLIYYPDQNGIEDSPEAVLNEVKAWRAANGLPGFKR